MRDESWGYERAIPIRPSLSLNEKERREKGEEGHMRGKEKTKEEGYMRGKEEKRKRGRRSSIKKQYNPIHPIPTLHPFVPGTKRGALCFALCTTKVYKVGR